jgi:hypothetical protein
MEGTKAQSESVGVILMVGVMVVTVTTGGVFALDSLVESTTPDADISITTQGQVLTVEHVGGTKLSTDKLQLRINGDEIPTTTLDLKQSDGPFEAGDSWSKDLEEAQTGVDLTRGSQVTVTLYHTGINALITQTDVFVSGLEGQGTESHPYKITNGDDLQYLSQDLSAHYKVTRDITYDTDSAGEFDPVATDEKFTGTLSGNGNTITGLRIDGSGDQAAMFGTVGDGAVITKLDLDDTKVDAPEATEAAVVAGEFYGVANDVRIENAEVTGGQYTGGFAAISSAQKYQEVTVKDTTVETDQPSDDTDVRTGGFASVTLNDIRLVAVRVPEVNGPSDATGAVVGMKTTGSSLEVAGNHEELGVCGIAKDKDVIANELRETTGMAITADEQTNNNDSPDDCSPEDDSPEDDSPEDDQRNLDKVVDIQDSDPLQRAVKMKDNWETGTADRTVTVSLEVSDEYQDVIQDDNEYSSDFNVIFDTKPWEYEADSETADRTATRKTGNTVEVEFELPDGIFKTDDSSDKLRGYIEYRIEHTTTKYEGKEYEMTDTTDQGSFTISPLPTKTDATPSDIERAVKRIDSDYEACISIGYCDDSEFTSPEAVEFPDTDQETVNVWIKGPDGEEKFVPFHMSNGN